MSTCSAAEIAEKRRIALERLRAKQAQSSSTTRTATQRGPEAQKFLNELTKCSNVKLRLDTRQATHPYQRPKPSTDEEPVVEFRDYSNGNQPVTSLTAYMVSPKRFAVKLSNYNAQLKDILNSIPSKKYDKPLWTFDLQDYQLLKERLRPLENFVVLQGIPKVVRDLCATEIETANAACLEQIEPNLRDKLMPFQEDGVCFGIARQGRVLICDEMGLGKTYQALAIADFYKHDWPLLICTTASTRQSWANHLRELMPNIAVTYIQILSSNQQYIGDAKVLITGYQMMDGNKAMLEAKNFKCIIFDESHMLKNPKAKCTKVAAQLALHAKRVIMLSGTPALSRPVELFSQLSMIDIKFMTFMDFTQRYCNATRTRFGWDTSGQSNLEELNVILRWKFMIRRTKAEVMPDIAAKHRETIVLDPALVWASNENLKEIFAESKNKLDKIQGRQREEMLLKFYAQTAELKVPAVCAYLKPLLKERFKFIVFAHHRVMINALCDFLLRQDVNFVRIDGSTKSEMRAEFIDAFQTRENCKVAVLSIRACNAGITLTAAEMIIFAELDWNPSTLAQAESRAHRIGQTKPVTCRYLMAKDTADDIIWKLLQFKQETLKKTGIFCENLQDATAFAAPTISNKIDKYFSPQKKETVTETQEYDLSKELENLDDFFQTQISQATDDTKPSTSAAAATKENVQIEDIFGNDDDDDLLFQNIDEVAETRKYLEKFQTADDDDDFLLAI